MPALLINVCRFRLTGARPVSTMRVPTTHLVPGELARALSDTDMSEPISPALSFMIPRIKHWPEAQTILPDNIALDVDNADQQDWVAAAGMREVAPAYPSSAARVGQETWVLVGAEFGRGGNVINTEVLKSRPQGVFDAAALKAARQIVMMSSPDIPDGETRAMREFHCFKVAQ